MKFSTEKNDFMHILAFRSQFHSNLPLAKYYDPNRVEEWLKYRHRMIFMTQKYRGSVLWHDWMQTVIRELIYCHSQVVIPTNLWLCLKRKYLYPFESQHIHSGISTMAFEGNISFDCTLNLNRFELRRLDVPTVCWNRTYEISNE